MDITDEIPVGSRIVLEAVENEGCDGCFFADLDYDTGIDCCQRIKCGATKRKDKKSVIFKFVEK